MKELDSMFLSDGRLKTAYAEACERTHKELSHMDWRDWFREFTL